MRRSGVVVVLALALLAGRSEATESYVSTETVVGWSEDGNTYAVVIEAGPGEGTSLVVRTFVAGKRDKVVETFDKDSPGVPEDTDTKAGVERIDVTKWAPIKKYKLRLIESASRTKFKQTYELGTVGKKLDSYHCKGGGWTLKKKGEAKPLVEVKAAKDHCFNPLGGYVHSNGKRALIKLTESSWSSAPEDGAASSDDTTTFVLVELP